ncbi:hypothetical protein Ancab_008363 [Ancistrocladus abbreviatus]
MACVIGIMLMTVCGFWLYFVYGKRKLTKERQSFFRQNGGLILNQELARWDASDHKFRVFSAEELENATTNYSVSSTIGKSGYAGKVYKGILPDGLVIAINKSLIIDPRWNVAKLLGCCQETEVPTLVYEFIWNGTLQDHLNDEAKASQLTWERRLSIAIEVAGVLSNVHSEAHPTIVHGEIKPTNVFLLDNYTTKVADFECSQFIKDPSQSERVLITAAYGYISPEALATGELTEKDDVYGFGVVLFQLLTRKKPQHLSSHFLCDFENHLFEILDGEIVSEETTDLLKEVAHVARACLSMKREERPTMREVEHELKGIRRTGKLHPLSHNKPVALPNQEEHEHLLQSTSNATNMYRSMNVDWLCLDGPKPEH